MKRIFLLKGLDCPNCSAKIEKEIGELDGVQSSVLNLTGYRICGCLSNIDCKRLLHQIYH